MSAQKEFKVNEYITLKLEGGRTNIYVKGKRFFYCKHLLLDIPTERIGEFEKFDSVDDVAVLFGWTERGQRGAENYYIDSETEFWGYCSTIQAWGENDYDTRLLPLSFSFALLEELKISGAPEAAKAFKRELLNRLSNASKPFLSIFIEEGLFKHFDNEYMEVFLKDQLLGITNTLTKNISLLEIMSDQLIDSLAEIILNQPIKFPNSIRLTEKSSILIEFFGFLDKIKELKKEKVVNKIISNFIYKLENILVKVRSKYVDDFFSHIKCINLLFKILIKIVCMELNYTNAALDAKDINGTEYMSKEEILDEFYDDIELRQIQIRLQGDDIIIDFSEYQWIDIKEKTYSIKKKAYNRKKRLKKLNIVEFIGEDLHVQIVNDPVFNTIIGPLTSIINFKITPEKFIISTTNTSLKWICRIRFNVESFHNFYCQRKIEFALDWEKIKLILLQSEVINEIEFSMKKIEEKIINIKLKIYDLDLDQARVVILEKNDVSYQEILNMDTLCNIKYTTEILLEPNELLPIFNFIGLKALGFNTYKDLTGDAKFCINITSPKNLKNFVVAEPKIKRFNFKELTRNIFRIKNLLFIKEIIPIINQLKLYLNENCPLRLDMVLKGGNEITCFIVPSNTSHDTGEIFYNQIYKLILNVLTDEWLDIKMIKKKLMKDDADEEFIKKRLNELGKKDKVDFGYINKTKLYRKRK